MHNLNRLGRTLIAVATLVLIPTFVIEHAVYAQGTVSASKAPSATSRPAPQPQDPAAIITEVESFLLSHAQQLPGSPQVVVTPPKLGRQTACDQMETFLSNPELRSRMSVGVRCLAPEQWSLYVQATVSVHGSYYVTNRTIGVGETISLDDLSAREGDLLRLARGVIVDPSQAVGYIAQQRINGGTILRASALRDPESIVRGQPVKTEARGLGFVANGEGVALESGAPGTLIQVRTSSGQIISGTVVNGTTVRVLM
jgi:flagella basal body P-ring formation protein FlgA